MMNSVLMRRFIRAAVCPFGLLVFASYSWAQQNSIENLEVTQAAGQVLVRVNMKNPIASAPGSFTIANPARRGTHELLNQRLSRSEFMPFAPVIAVERASEVFDVNPVNARVSGPFLEIL